MWCHIHHCDGTMRHWDGKVGHSGSTVQHCCMEMEHYEGTIDNCDVTGNTMMIVLPVSANIFALDIHDSLATLFKFRAKCHLL